MTRLRKLLVLVAAVLIVMAVVPVASASPGAPLRGSGTATFVGDGWAYDFDGELDCTGFAVVPESRIVGPEPLATGTMHWFEIMTLDCDDGTMVLEGYGTWTFANGKFRVNGVVVEATGAYSHLIGASAHQQGMVDPAVFPFAGVDSLRIN